MFDGLLSDLSTTSVPQNEKKAGVNLVLEVPYFMYYELDDEIKSNGV